MKRVKSAEGGEFAVVECIVKYVSGTLVTLEYQYEKVYYHLQLPQTEQNNHLKVGDKVTIALGIEIPVAAFEKKGENT